jgi:signal transduction histidine kinase
LLNLVRNAWDAMPEGGNIVIDTDIASKPRIETAHWPANVGRFAVLRVSDEGTGIGPEILPRVFDARITTKPNGQGLGLATIKAIVDGHDGVVAVESRPGSTTFEIAFPLVVPEV